MEPVLVSGAENRFLLFDLRAVEPPEDPAALARRRCAMPVRGGARPDGCLLLHPDATGRAVRLEIRNRDGSRPEACGNGLRAAALFVFEERGARAGDSLVIATDAGPREVRLVAREGPGAARLAAELGAAEVFAPHPVPPLETGEGLLGAVRLGNPHLVLAVEDERAVDVDRRGRELQRIPAFPGGVNVGFLARRGGAPRLRVFERGVGETRACGTGAGAAAALLFARGEARAPLEVLLPGGALSVALGRRGELVLEGPARIEGRAEQGG